jgi:hypothetical protein
VFSGSDRRSDNLAHQAKARPQCFGAYPPAGRDRAQGEIIVALALIILLGYVPLLALIVRDAIKFDRQQSKASASTKTDLAGGIKPSIQECREAVAELVEEKHSTPGAADTLDVGHVPAAPDATVLSETDRVDPSSVSSHSSKAVVLDETASEDAPLSPADGDAAATVVSPTFEHQDDVLPGESETRDATLDGDKNRIDDMDAPGVRDAIASEIELEISKAVKVVPGCEDFRGVIVAFARSNSPSNWDVHGIRFGKAERAIASDAVATVVTRLQQNFKLVEGK